MADTFDKVLDAVFHPERGGLVWVQTVERMRLEDGEWSAYYDIWLLVQRGTDRVLASIDAPLPNQICFGVQMIEGPRRNYISIDGARRFALASALAMLDSERAASSANRKERRRGVRLKL